MVVILRVLNLLVASIIIVHGDTSVREDIVVVVIFHPELTVIGILPAKLFFQFVSPVGIIVSPRTSVVLVVPWISQLGKRQILTIVLDRLHVQETVGVTTDQSHFILSAAAATCHWEILRCIVFVQFHELGFLIAVEIIVVRWHASKCPQAFLAPAAHDSVVVLVQLGVRFLQERHPPSSGS